MSRAVFFLLCAVVLCCSCRGRGPAETNTAEERIMKLEITSSAFKDSEMIPSKHTCDGADVSPPLQWSSVPEAAESFAIICDDPDAPAGTWVHWVIYNIPGHYRELKEGIPPEKTLADGIEQGVNDFGKIGYGGPCPPSGTHRYYFKIYALDSRIEAGPGLTKTQLLESMKGHVIAEGRLMGRYSRS